MKLWTRADYEAATAHDDARRARDAAQRAHDDAQRAWDTPMPPQTDPWADDHGRGATPRPWTPEDDALDAACDAVSGLLQAGRGNTPATPPTPTAPTLLETLVADFGPAEAFRVWAQRRTPTPCTPELWAAQSALADAKEAENDAIASAAEARLVRRAAAADLAEARAKVAVERARIARARVG